MSLAAALPSAGAIVRKPGFGSGGLGGGGFGANGVDRFGRGGRVTYARDGLARGGEKLEQLARLSEAAPLLGDVSDAEFGYTANALVAQSGKSAEAARKLFESATGKDAPSDRRAVQQILTQACLLDSAAANVGQSDGSIAAQTIEKLEELHAADVKDWSAKLPQLATKLDLVIRDQSLADAIAQVAKAAKLDINLVEGSVADATALAGPEAARVSYLPLLPGEVHAFAGVPRSSPLLQVCASW
jgi:hypothetical protein